MTIRVLQTGIHPDHIDFNSPDFAQFKGLSHEKLRKANDDNIAGLQAAGFEVDNVLVDFGETAEQVVEAQLEGQTYDAILIGAGIRLVASNTLLFESLVNLFHRKLPEARFVFNYDAESTPNDILRWFDSPEAAGPVR